MAESTKVGESLTVPATGPIVAAVDITVPDEGYDATAWNGSLEVPTKNAMRDKIESLAGGVTDGDKGDITVSSSGSVWTVDNDAVTYAKLQDVSATDRLLGRDTAGAGNVEELTVGGGVEFTGTGIQTSAFTGDVTKSAGGTATTIANDAVSNAKAANMAADTIKGRANGAGTGDPTDLTATQVRTIINVEDGADVTDATNVNTAGAVMESDYDANTVLAANSDNTPLALTMGASTILARLAAGNIKAATPAELRTLLDVPTNAEAILDTLADANSVLYAVSDNTPAALAMGASTILARLATGDVIAATPAQLRTLLDVPTNGEAVLDTLFDANSILIATSDNTPLALTVAASRVLGRKASGDIDDMTGAETAAVLAGEVFKQAQEINAQTGTTYTLVAGDAGKLVTLSNAGAITLTVPQDSDATIAVGTYVDLYQLGAGQVTTVAGSGATLRVSGLTAKARAQYARFGVQKVSANTWNLFGDLAAS